MSFVALVADLYFHPRPREYSSDFLNLPKKKCASHSLMFLSNSNSSNLNLDYCDVLDFIFGKTGAGVWVGCRSLAQRSSKLEGPDWILNPPDGEVPKRHSPLPRSGMSKDIGQVWSNFKNRENEKGLANSNSEAFKMGCLLTKHIQLARRKV